MKNKKKIMLFFMGLAFCSVIYGEDRSDARFSVGLGVAGVKSVYKTKDKYDLQPLAVVRARYKGLYLDFNEVGYDVFDEDGMKLSVIGKAYLGYDSDDLKYSDAMEDRKINFYMGVKTTYSYDRYQFITFATADVERKSDGKIIGFEGSGTYTLIDRKLYFIPAFGISYADSQFIDYFYGVRSSEASAGNINGGKEYSGSGEVIYSIKGVVNYIYNGSLSLQWVNAINLYGDHVSRSPIVERNHSFYTGFLVTYRFI